MYLKDKNWIYLLGQHSGEPQESAGWYGFFLSLGNRKQQESVMPFEETLSKGCFVDFS
jgi:hypothetical protein